MKKNASENVSLFLRVLQANEEAEAKIRNLFSTVCRLTTPTEASSTTTVPAESYRHHHHAAPLRCAIAAGKNVTDEFELNSIWVVFEPTFLEHVANITNCAGDGVDACVTREQLAARTTYLQFLAAVGEVRVLNIEKNVSENVLVSLISRTG